jgi:hypothetical protein
LALYGDNLARAIRPGTTWGQALDVAKSVADGVRACYSSLDLWDNWKDHGTIDSLNLAVLSVISPDDAKEMRRQLDEELARNFALQGVMVDREAEEGTDAVMSEDYRQVLQSRVNTATDTIALCDRLFHTSVGSEVSDAVVPVVGNLSDTVANAASKVVGNLVAGLWWVFALGLAGLLLWHKYGHKVAT